MLRWPLPKARIARCRHGSPQTQIPITKPFSSSHARNEKLRVGALLAQRRPIEDVEVSGWIRSIRKQKRVTFVALGDGSSLDPLQAVLSPELSIGLTHGAAAVLRGAWIPSTGKNQSNELQVSTIELQGDNDAERNPVQPKYQTAEYLRTIPHLRAQVPSNALLLQLRSKLIVALTQWFDEQNFVQCHTPIVTSSDCEGAGEVFSITTCEEATGNPSTAAQPFFRGPKYLTVSAQLHLEAMSQAVDRTWTLSPTFRAEKSDTQRHLSEFYMLEAELSFTEHLDSIMNVVEDMLRSAAIKLRGTQLVEQLMRPKHGVEEAAATAEGEAAVSLNLRARWDGLVRPAWPRITYAEAVKHLVDAAASGTQRFTIEPSAQDGLAAEHERYIATKIGAGSPVFVTDYPIEQKPFYMAQSTNDTAACFDLLVPDLCELAGGSIREHKLDALEAAMSSKGVSGQGLEWYKDLRRYGSVPHGGFGLGFDRLLCYLSGVANVKDVVSFPRYHGRCDC